LKSDHTSFKQRVVAFYGDGARSYGEVGSLFTSTIPRFASWWRWRL